MIPQQFRTLMQELIDRCGAVCSSAMRQTGAVAFLRTIIREVSMDDKECRAARCRAFALHFAPPGHTSCARSLGFAMSPKAGS